jgi:hypothetical protein
MPSRRSPSQHLQPAKQFEVAVLVEDVVGRQQPLAEAWADPAIAEQGRRVEQRTSFIRWVGLGQPDEHGGTAGELRRQLGQRAPAPFHERGTQQEIARQVPGECQLWSHRERGAAASGDRRGVRDQLRVAGEIAHRGIDLKERDLH